MTGTRTQVTAALAAAAFVLAAILAISPRTTVVANEVSGEIYGIDILGIAKNASDVPAQVAAH